MSTHDSDSLTDEELEYYSRQIVLPDIGYEGQQKLHDASVCIAGVGGLGSVAATQLAAMGVGHLRLVDYDVVELSNLHRQHLYDVNAIGYPKVEIAAGRLRDLNPHVDIEPLPLAIGAHNAEEIVTGMDVVVDGLDRIVPRYAVNSACVKLGVPYVFGAAVSMYGNVSTILPQETACLECFYGSIEDDALPSCSILGVHPAVISLVASIEVAETTRVLLGHKPRLANRLLHCDIEAMAFEQVELSKTPSCPVCGLEPRPAPATPAHRLVTELCSRDGQRTFAIIPQRNLKLDMEQVCGLVVKRGFRVKVSAGLGTTFDWSPTGRASLLSSGIMIVEGARDEGEAYDLFRRLVIHGLGVPESDVDHQSGPSDNTGAHA